MNANSNKVFGIGWAKTGTTTLGKCFELLNFNHQTQDLDLVQGLEQGDLSRIMQVATEKDTFEDWPWILLYKEFDAAFPGSKFVLTKRDPSKWIQSYRNMLAGQGDVSAELNQIRRTLYGLPFPGVTEQQLLDRYEKHNREVAEYFKDRPDDLLVVDWESGDGWPELCAFLGRDIPGTPFPHANKGNYSRLKKMLPKVVLKIGRAIKG